MRKETRGRKPKPATEIKTVIKTIRFTEEQVKKMEKNKINTTNIREIVMNYINDSEKLKLEDKIA